MRSKFTVWLLTSVLFGLTSCKLTPGLKEITVNSTKRDYWLFLPDNPQPTTPLIVLLHDYDSNGAEIASASGLEQLSDEFDLIIVAPNASGIAFNDGTGLVDSVNDVQFIDQVIQKMKNGFELDHIHLAGLGSGANMALRMALESVHELTGITVVGGHIFVPLSDKKPPKISYFLYGNADPLIPVNGDNININDHPIRIPAADTTINRWKSWLECGTTVTSRVADLVDQQVWTTCRDRVGMVAMKARGLGHYWPRRLRAGEFIPETPDFGPYQPRIDVSLIMLDLIKRDQR